MSGISNEYKLVLISFISLLLKPKYEPETIDKKRSK